MNRLGATTRKGFTLVELLVSITLTIFILTLFATLFGAGNDAVRAARGSGEIDRSVQGSITKIKRDLEHVYIGEGVRLSEAFTSASTIPSAGYFTIEENLPASLPHYCQSEAIANSVTSPAHDPNFQKRVIAINNRLSVNPAGKPAVGYRQGIDDRGLPVEVDVDDVLAFTVRLSGDSPSDIFYGRVPVGSVLDNDLDPGSRFDSPDNGQFTSPMAEVCYFLRADRPYELAEINRPALGTDDGRLARAATYTLYRRELLVLSESQRTRVEERLVSASVLRDVQQAVATVGGQLRNPSLFPISGNQNFNASLYHQYDVAFRFDPLLAVVRFNDISALRLRQNRYGMQWAGYGSPFPDTKTAAGRVLNPQLCGPFYDHDPAVADVTLRTHLPGRAYPAGIRRIFRGRPTLFESTLVGYQGYIDGNNANYNPITASNHASWNFGDPSLRFDEPTSAPIATTARRGNSDVLLTNVLSFDVKVLNDDVPQGLRSELIPSNAIAGAFAAPFTSADLDATSVPTLPRDLSQWPASRTSSLVPLSPTDQQIRFIDPGLTLPVVRSGMPVANPSRRASTAAPFPAGSQLPVAAMIQTDFVDLGQSLVQELPSGFGIPQGGRTWDQEARTVLPNSIATQIGYPVTFSTREVAWGRHTPSRWVSMGRPEAWLNLQFTTLTQPVANVYDTWAPEYNAQTFATEFFASLPTPRPTKYLPPYDRPLRGIQITIRTLEPRSGLVREFQVVHRF